MQQQDGEQHHRHGHADEGGNDAGWAASTGDRRRCGEHASLVRPRAVPCKRYPDLVMFRDTLR
jgi:hypothetical protein